MTFMLFEYDDKRFYLAWSDPDFSRPPSGRCAMRFRTNVSSPRFDVAVFGTGDTWIECLDARLGGARLRLVHSVRKEFRK